MIFTPADLDFDDLAVLEEIHARRDRLAGQLRAPRRWQGLLRRNLVARAIQGSNSIEGYVVDTDDAVAAIDDQEPLTPDQRAFAEVRGYRQALGYVLTLSGDSTQPVDEPTLRALHFMMLGHDLEKSPGKYRETSIYVQDERRGQTVYEGPDSDQVPDLMAALVDSLDQDIDDPLIQAALAHLNLVMIHPFRDGNGRMARTLQTWVLGRSGIIEPPFSSIEEWLGANTDDYYRALAVTGAGHWNPGRSTHLWIKFNLRAHHMQSLTVERRARRSELLWQELENAIATLGLPPRTFDALFDAALGYRIRRAGYAHQADVTDQTATRDLSALTSSGMLTAHGEKRGRHYTAAPALIELRARVTSQIDIPVTEPYPDFRVRLASEPTLS